MPTEVRRKLNLTCVFAGSLPGSEGTVNVHREHTFSSTFSEGPLSEELFFLWLWFLLPAFPPPAACFLRGSVRPSIHPSGQPCSSLLATFVDLRAWEDHRNFLLGH